MKNGYYNLMTSRYLRFFLITVLVYFSQVNPFNHIHHFHEDGLLEFEISSHPVEIDIEHESDHHHDSDSSHKNDHQHTYDNQIDWHIVRTQSQKSLSFENQCILSSISINNTDDNSTTNCNFLKPPLIDSYEISTLIIRGPPLSA